MIGHAERNALEARILSPFLPMPEKQASSRSSQVKRASLDAAKKPQNGHTHPPKEGRNQGDLPHLDQTMNQASGFPRGLLGRCS